MSRDNRHWDHDEDDAPRRRPRPEDDQYDDEDFDEEEDLEDEEIFEEDEDLEEDYHEDER